MTHVELIEAIKADYQKEFKENSVTSETVEAFQKGVIFAYDYLLTVLKNGDSWIYEGDKNGRK